jgi:hypothetical protein
MSLKIFSTGWLAELVGKSEIQAVTKTKWQRKQNAVQYTANQTDIPSMRFSNLTIGKTYRLSMQISVINGDSSAQVFAIHNGSAIAAVSNKTTSVNNNDRSIAGTSTIFMATATTLTFNYVEFDPAGQLDAGEDTFAVLEELPNHEVTTDWT